MDYSALPGGELVSKGLTDLEAGQESVEAILVSVGAARLRAAGIDVPGSVIEDPEHALYAALASETPDDAHSRYNALVRRLVSFERALECARI